MRRLIALAFLATAGATPAAAEEQRTWPVASFDRLRIEGPVDVVVTPGSPSARTVAADRATAARLSIASEGNVLIVRLTGAAPAGLGTGDGAVAAARVALAVPRLSAVRHQGSGRVSVARLVGERVDVGGTGGGTLTVDAIETRQLAATLVGGGTLTLAGRVTRARLTLNGEGTLNAAALVADEAAVSLVGSGEVIAAARYAAQVAAGPAAGRVAVAGGARCTIRASGEAKVRCGTALR